MKKMLIVSVLSGLLFISCAKDKEVKTEGVVNDSIQKVEDSLAITPRQTEEEIITFEEAFKRAHVGEVFWSDEDWEVEKVSNAEYILRLTKEAIKQMENSNPRNVNEEKLPPVPANVKDATTLKGKGYKFSSETEGDIYYVRFVVTSVKINFLNETITEVMLKSKLNWEYEYGFDYMVVTPNDGEVYNRASKADMVGYELTIPCYIGGRTKKELTPITY
jgi:lipoprotein